jgi:hypothetical protein
VDHHWRRRRRRERRWRRRKTLLMVLELLDQARTTEMTSFVKIIFVFITSLRFSKLKYCENKIEIRSSK